MFESWIDFALVARDLAGDKPLAEIQLMNAIADATLDARHQRAIA